MIVDDSLAVRRKIERCAKTRQGVTVLMAVNGRDAITLFKTEMPDLVTMDLTMPELGGVECIKVLANLNPKVHILVVSALSDKVTALAAIKNGAEGFLKKPFSDEALAIALTELLETEPYET
ncbi:MAG: two-component system chemotaxis response regulator CheY [Candidatus Endobugula sp.]|jgi:two-component system chemotaxis response regulator CheY